VAVGYGHTPSTLRLLYYLPMERMKKRTDFYDAIDKIQRQDKYIEYIEEENRKLKDSNTILKKG
jgi:hypothetical protein